MQDAGTFTVDPSSVKGKQKMFATKLIQRDSVPPLWMEGMQQRHHGNRISIIVLLPLLSPRACIMRPWLAWTGFNSNGFYCSVTVWILKPKCPGWPCLTIWKPEGSQSLYIMHDLRVPQSVIPAPNNNWADRYKSLSGRGDLEPRGFVHAVHHE